jgi:hypothetical protein
MKQNNRRQSTIYGAQDQIKRQYIETMTILNKFGTKKYRLLNQYFDYFDYFIAKVSVHLLGNHGIAFLVNDLNNA